jgi:threonine dehydrogenase-like Zn-dependent dehydrogenase
MGTEALTNRSTSLANAENWIALWYDRAKTSMFLATDRPHALRQAISACRKGGTVSIPGVYGGWLDKSSRQQ